MNAPYETHVHPFAVSHDPSTQAATRPDVPPTHGNRQNNGWNAHPNVNPDHGSTSIASAEAVSPALASTELAPAEPASVPVPPAPEPSPTQKQAIDLVSRLLIVSQEAKQALNARLAEFDLNDIRYSVLSIVREAATDGCSQSMLAQRLRQSESSISTLVDRMRTSGLLYRLRSKTDRRKRYLTLTDRGRQLLAAADSQYGECVDEILTGLGHEDRTIFGVLLKRVLVQLDGDANDTQVHTTAA